MTVPADPAKDQARTATTGSVNLRENSRWAAGSLLYDGREQLVTGWHFHDVHEIEYACHGMVEVKTKAGHYLLPPHQAAWIPAGLQHQTTLHAGAQTLAVLFGPGLVPVAGDRVRIITVSALLREMMLYSARWPISRTASGAEAGTAGRPRPPTNGESAEPLESPTAGARRAANPGRGGRVWSPAAVVYTGAQRSWG
jgi:quercetin dioxygenase-like cupin family protein